MTKKKSCVLSLFFLFSILFAKPSVLHSIQKPKTPINSTQTAVLPLPTKPTYKIEAQLLPREKKLLGSTTITWTNPSKYKIRSFRFHLYYNAFNNEKTTLLQELRYYKKSEYELAKMQFGYIKINEIRIVEGEELTSKIHYISPDDQNPHDHTVMEVELDESIKPSQSIDIKINYILLVPEIIFKSGQAGDFFFMSQWYPQLGVLQKNGSWNCHQYHRNSEFFSNFGNYEVSITLPEKFTIGATGNLEKKIKNADGTYSFLFKENNIHDFAWVAYPGFQEIIERIKLKGNREPTKIVLLLSPEDQNEKIHLLDSLKLAMKYYAENIFPYPLKKITMVVQPLKALRSGNQAYPGLICISKSNRKTVLSKPILWRIIHEFGHQYWSGIIRTDRVREPWLDEGINAFFDMEILDKSSQYNKSHINWILFRITISQYYYWKYLSYISPDPPNQYSWKFFNQASFNGNAIFKPAILFRSLKNHIGKKKMIAFFKFYARKYRGKHANTDDIIQAFNLFFNSDYSWAFNQFINRNLNLDHSIFSIESTRVKTNPQKYRNEVVCLRKEGYFPADILIKLKNGKEIKYYWNEMEKWKKIIIENDCPLEYVIIDPQNKILLDRNPYNNSKYISNVRSGRLNIAIKLGLYFQTLLSFLFL